MNAQPLTPTTAWFTVPLQFLNESDQDTVSLVLNRALAGMTLRLVTADGLEHCVQLKEANADVANFDAIYQASGALAASMMEFHLLDLDYKPTGECLLVRYCDVTSLGVY